MRADSRFTSLGYARGDLCPNCHSFIDTNQAVTVKNCIFEKPITAPGSRFILALEDGSVRMEGNTFDATTDKFEVEDAGDVSALNYLL
jgi:hypothetical protein